MKLRIIVAACAFLAVSTAKAGVMAELQDMFMANGTPPSTISTKDKVSIFGGSYSARAPMQSVNIVSFDPPRMNAGCGGIDIYGGSFSFINSDQLIAVFRAVAANAAGLAFKAAIKAISPNLDQLMTEFQTLLQNMNNLAKNSCNLAKAVVGPEGLLTKALTEGTADSAKKGWFSDEISALTGYMSDANKFLKDHASVTPKVGNPEMKSILNSGASSMLGMVGLANPDGSLDDASDPNSLNNRVLISLLGYRVTGVPCESQNNAGTADTSAVVNTNGMSRVDCVGVATITLDDFVTGGGTGSTRPAQPWILYRCLDPNGTDPSLMPSGGFDRQPCLQMKREEYTYKGVAGWVNEMLFGTPDGSSVTADSIVGLANSSTNTSVNFSTTQKQFLNGTQLKILPMFRMTTNPDVRVAIAHKMKAGIVNCVTSAMGEALLKTTNNIQNANSLDLAESTKQNIERLREDYIRYTEKCIADRSQLEIFEQLRAGAMMVNQGIQ